MLQLIEEERLNRLEARLNDILNMLSQPIQAVKTDDDETYTIATLAKKLKWSRGKVSAELKAGTIRSHRIGGRVVILRDELLEDLRRNGNAPRVHLRG